MRAPETWMWADARQRWIKQCDFHAHQEHQSGKRQNSNDDISRSCNLCGSRGQTQACPLVISCLPVCSRMSLTMVQCVGQNELDTRASRYRRARCPDRDVLPAFAQEKLHHRQGPSRGTVQVEHGILANCACAYDTALRSLNFHRSVTVAHDPPYAITFASTRANLRPAGP